MLQKEILCLENKVIHSEISSSSDFEELWKLSLSDQYSISERNSCIVEFAKAFWILCVFYQGDIDSFSEIEQIKTFINYINAFISSLDREFYNDKELVFISFLHGLLHRDELLNAISSSSFMDFYNKLYDVIERVKWIFSLESEDGKKVFPIRNLIEDVANTFKLDQEHYLQLVFSLEIFNSADLGEGDRDAVREKMLSLANEYHILLIELLCNGGRVLFDGNASANSALNGTIIVETEEKILIRNTRKSYFIIEESLLENYIGENGYEGKDEQNPMAYYYMYNKCANEKLVDLKFLLSKCPNRSRLEAINYILTSGYSNVFLGECFWICQDTQEFRRVINPFGYKDEEVVTEKGRLAEGTSKFEKFINTMTNELDEFGTCSIAKRGNIDVLTLDFVLLFYKELVCEGNSYLEQAIKIAEVDRDYYQNILFKLYFEEAFSTGYIFEAIQKYRIFVKKYFPFEEVTQRTKFSQYNKLVLPFRPFILCEGELEKFCDKLVEYEYFPKTTVKMLKIEKSGRTKTKYLIDDVEIPFEHMVNMFSTQIEEGEAKEGFCLYNHEDKMVYLVNTRSNNIEGVLRGLNDALTKGILLCECENSYPKLENIIKIICNIGFSDFMNTFHRNVFECVECATENIAIYKLLWHMQFWGLEGRRYELFSDLILNRYYTEFVMNPHKYIKEFFDDLMVDNNAGKLIIAKESDGEGATLKELFDRYNNGGRGPLRKAFDGSQITANYKKTDMGHFYHEKEIDSIVFITDNVLSGKSTNDMLDFYLCNAKKAGDPRTYLWNESVIVPDIIKSNPTIKIEVKTILCTNRGKAKIKSKFKDYAIEVFPILNLPDTEFNWTSDVEDIVVELYETDKNPDRRDVIQCIFRPCNMPAENILPDSVKDVSLLLGLFERKGEF